MQSYTIHKPRKDGKSGTAIRFQYKETKEKYPKKCVMVELVNQTGIDANDNASFGWAGKKESNSEEYAGIICKFGLPDIGEFLCVLNGIKKNAGSDKGLYHQNAKGNLGIKFGMTDQGFYSLNMSKKSDEVLTRLSISILPHEAEILRMWFNQFLTKNFE